jgi:MYXO-CTERM domain-containing protein
MKALLIIFAAASLTCAVANADTVFDISGTVGDIYGTSTPSDFGYTGLTVTGTITIDTVGGTVDAVDISVETDPNDLINVMACSSDCTYAIDSTFSEYGLVDLGTSFAGYTGGSLAGDSWVYLDNPNGVFGGLGLGEGGSGENYYISGTLTAETAAAPEPRYTVALLGLGMLGSLLFIRRRRQA